MMKIGVISDTHIPITGDKLPKGIAKYFQDVEMILHAGDLVDLTVLNQLKKYTQNIEAVSGNMDSNDVTQSLPKKKLIKIGKYTIGLIHGWGSAHDLPERVRKEFTQNVDVIVFGHSHQPVNMEKDGILFFNPGSPMDKIFAKVNSIGILEINEKIKGTIIEL